MNVKIIVSAKKIMFGILAHVFFRIVSVDDTSVITCDKIVSVMDNVSIKMTNTVAENLSINSDAKKVSYKMDCFILHAVFLNIKLLLTIAITCYHYENQVKTKRH